MSEAPSIARLLPLAGRWQGVSRVWFEPGKLAGEHPVQLEATILLGDRFVQFDYRTQLSGKPVEGRITAGYYPDRKRWEMHLIDSFHMGRGQLFCVGASTESGFSVMGHYPDGQGGPDWGWRTELAITGPDAFSMTAYNVEPSAAEAKATEMALERIR